MSDYRDCPVCWDDDTTVCPEHMTPNALFHWLRDDAWEERAFGGLASDDLFAEAVSWGAGWMAALIGMGEAIRRGRFCVLCGRPMTYLPGWGDDLCGTCAREM